MKKFALVANAAIVIIDDFNTSQGPVLDVAGGGATVSGTVAPSAGEPWSNRTISVTATGSGLFTGDPAAVATGGLFGINNDSIETSTVRVTWSLGAISGFTGSGGNFVVDLFNNNPSNLIPTTITLAFGSTTLGAFPLPPVPPGPMQYSLALNAAQFAALIGGTTASLTFNGGDGYDAVINKVYVEQVGVPAPASLALLGMGFVALMHSKRRKYIK
jgi:hypothetical protein